MIPPPGSAVVVDASIALKWGLPEPDSDKASLLPTQRRLMAPELLLPECGNGLQSRVRRGLISRDFADAAFATLLRMPIRYTSDRDLVIESRILAGRLGHPIRDCLYVALAIRAEVPLVTAEQRLVKALSAAKGLRVMVYVLDQIR